MEAKRCETCGEVRWSFIPRSEETETRCPACGAQMVEERRQPGREPRFLREERRDAGAFLPRLNVT